MILLLVMPMVLVIGGQSIGLLTGWYRLDRLMNAPGPPWVTLLTASTLGVLLALVMVLAARLRIVAGRRNGSRQLTVTLHTTALETLGLVVAAGILALFVAHLFADAFACARGIRGAC